MLRSLFLPLKLPINMTPSQAQQEIQVLSKQIDEHNERYYVKHQPTIADTQYDELLKKLMALEEQFPQFKLPTSPSQRVGAKVEGNIPTVAHQNKMLSLDNTYSMEDIKDWVGRVVKGLDGVSPELMLEPKIDGVSCALMYRNGELVLGATRGDGSVGEDVTHNVRTIRSVPLKLKGAAPAVLEIRGEVYMDKEDFAKLNQEREKAGEEIFVNPRNAASGALKLLDSRLTALRHLKFFVHSVGLLDGKNQPLTQGDFLQECRTYGFMVNEHNRICKTFEEIVEFCQQIQQQRQNLDYDVDGIVLKVNEIELQKRLGHTLK
ncbi:MAG: NAD-dependent DNA ligase LigA, partial [Candidatus Omnitrophica bacterium]|nr:NAD-dependent DNA ligase LigA [Candidatus Omnitrophota bacterium]